MEQKQEREERRSQLELGALAERPERLFVKEAHRIDTNTHSYTHRVQKHFGQNKRFPTHGESKTQTFKRRKK